MIKRTNKIIALIMSATTVTTLGSSINAFAADKLEGKEGDFSSAFAYSNKYLYDGSRGSDEDEQTVYYNNGKYNELEDTDAYDSSIKYDNKYIELDNDGDENLFDLQTGQFEDESIEDKELYIKKNLIKELKDTKRYGNDVGDYFQLGKRISTNKGSFGDIWYEYSADYNYGQATKYVTIIDVAANANDGWDNITLKKGAGIESNFGDSYQFWFSVTTNEPTNKETDGQAKTYNGDIAAASEYIAGRLKDYCGYDAEVITEKGKPVIQIISDEKLDGDVITGHNNDISVVTRKALAKNIEYVADDGGTSNDTGSTVEANNYISLVTQDVYASATTDAAVQYVTTIDINAITEHQWKNITLEKGDGITSEFGDDYQFWFSITANEPDNKESDGKAKTYNGDVVAASEYIAERIRDYCGYDATVVEENGKTVIQITSDVQLDGDVILSYDDNISVTTEEVSSTDDTTENPDEGSTENPTDDTVENPDENPDEDPIGDTTEDTTDAAVEYVTTIDINAITEHQWRNITLEKGDGITSEFGDDYQFWFSITANEPDNKESDGKAKTYNGDAAAASEYIAERIRDYCGYDATVVEENGKTVIQITSNVQLDGDVILSYDDNISVTTEEVNSDDDTTENPDEGSTENPTDDTVENPDEDPIEDPDEPIAGIHAIVNYDKLPIYYGVVNNNEKYMDISQLANIKLAYTVNGETKTVSIEEFGEKYGEENIEANLTSIDVFTQDSNYLYARANVEFTSDSDISVVYSDGGNSKEYILRISKALGEKVDGAYTPKEVTAYEMNGEPDLKWWMESKLNDDWYNLETYANNGNLFVVRFQKDGTNNKIQINQIGFETKRDDELKVSRNKVYKINDPSIETRMKGTRIETTDATELRNIMKPYYSIDSEGGFWVLGLKKIYKFNGGGFDEKYIVPAMISNLDVYNKDSLVAWGDNGADYSYVTNINEYTKDNADETSDEDSSGGSGNAGNAGGAGNAGINNDVSKDEVKAKNGWIQTKSGWQFFDESGVQVKNSWIKLNEKWYLINENGIMQTGWANVNGKWYYQYTDGSMATGWIKLGDNWYYLQPDGSMATGWVNADGNWYYLKQSGEISMGWINDSGNWYHLGTDGSMSTGWLKYANKWYYLDENGKMLSNATIDGYKLGNDGALI